MQSQSFSTGQRAKLLSARNVRPIEQNQAATLARKINKKRPLGTADNIHRKKPPLLSRTQQLSTQKRADNRGPYRASPMNLKSFTNLDGYTTEMGTSTETPGISKYMRNDDRLGLPIHGYNTHDEATSGIITRHLNHNLDELDIHNGVFNTRHHSSKKMMRTTAFKKNKNFFMNS